MILHRGKICRQAENPGYPAPFVLLRLSHKKRSAVCGKAEQRMRKTRGCGNVFRRRRNGIYKELP